MPQKHEITINYEENVLFLEIEKNDDWSEENISEEEYNDIRKKNDKITHDSITTKLLANTGVCNCQMEQFTKKHMAKAKLLYGTNQTYQQQYQAKVEQEDVDKFKFSVIVTTENGVMDPEPACIMRECKHCHKVDVWGDIDVMTRIVAESTANKITNQMAEERRQRDAEEAMRLAEMNNGDVVDAEVIPVEESEEGLMFETISEETNSDPVENTEPAE